MNIRNNIKQLIRRLTEVRYIGRVVRISVAVWRAPQTRALLDETRAALHQTNVAKDDIKTQLDETRAALKAISEGYGAAIRGLENCVKRHEISFGTLKLSIENVYDKKIDDVTEELRRASEKFEWISIDNDNIRSRNEFIRKEVMFELRKNLKIVNSSGLNKIEVQKPRIINFEKLNSAGVKRLNLGCGHTPKADFINVDARDLPGVDLISDVTSLPFEKNSIDDIYAAHLVEHFSERSLTDIILPHWLEILKAGGELTLIVPDAKSMINGFTQGEFSFEELREVIFGGQEYDGDFHFTMLTPESAVNLLERVGFVSADILTSGRRNGACYEFEIHARKKT